MGIAAAQERRGPESRDLGDETEEVDEGITGISPRADRWRPRLERCSHPARGLDEPLRLVPTVPWRRSGGARCTRPHCLGIEGPDGLAARFRQHLVGQLCEASQRAGPRTRRGVDRLPDLESPLGTGDHVSHTHYVTHYKGPVPPASANLCQPHFVVDRQQRLQDVIPSRAPLGSMSRPTSSSGNRPGHSGRVERPARPTRSARSRRSQSAPPHRQQRTRSAG